jgi:hypothetical protein
MIGHNSEKQDVEKILKFEIGNDGEDVHDLSSEKIWVSLPDLAKVVYKTIKVCIITYQSAGIKNSDSGAWGSLQWFRAVSITGAHPLLTNCLAKDYKVLKCVGGKPGTNCETPQSHNNCPEPAIGQ